MLAEMMQVRLPRGRFGSVFAVLTCRFRAPELERAVLPRRRESHPAASQALSSRLHGGAVCGACAHTCGRQVGDPYCEPVVVLGS